MSKKLIDFQNGFKRHNILLTKEKCENIVKKLLLMRILNMNSYKETKKKLFEEGVLWYPPMNKDSILKKEYM